MKVEIEEQDLKSIISSQVSTLCFGEKNPKKIQECHKLDERNQTANGQNTLTRHVLELSTETTGNIKQSQLAVQNIQVMNLNFNEIKVEQDVNANQPLNELKVMQYREAVEEKTHLMLKRYVVFIYIYIECDLHLICKPKCW